MNFNTQIKNSINFILVNVRALTPKTMRALLSRSKRVRTPVALLRLFSDQYHWECYEPPYPPAID